MRTLVTGGAGFIGSHIAQALLERGDEVRILDDFSTGYRQNIEPIGSAIELFEGDMRDDELVRRAMEGVEVVFHQAALVSVPRSIADPIASTAVNVVGMTTVLKAAVDAGVRRVVYAASAAAYGNAEDRVAEHRPARPLSPYAVCKVAGEHLLQAFSQCYPIETLGLRYFNVFGERQDPNSEYSGVIARFCKQMLTGERPTIYGDGTTSRDFTYVANVVQGNLLAASAPLQARGQVMNVACGYSVSLIELVQHLNAILGSDLQPRFGPERPGDIKHSCADISLARTLIGYEPLVDYKSGLARTVSWYRSLLLAR